MFQSPGELLIWIGLEESTPLSSSPEKEHDPGIAKTSSKARSFPDVTIQRSDSAGLLQLSIREHHNQGKATNIMRVPLRRTESSTIPGLATSAPTDRSSSPPPPPLSTNEALNRAVSLSKKLSGSNIPTHLNESGDLMLDMTGYKSSEDEALRAELVARKILAEELEGNYDIGALIGADERGNLWIYSSEEAKEAADQRAGLRSLAPTAVLSDAASDPGYQSDEERVQSSHTTPTKHQRTHSGNPATGLVTPPHTPPTDLHTSGDPNRNYAKTLRLTSEQLKALNLKPGANSMSFGVNRATCQANMFYWAYDVPIVISDIDGTITKWVFTTSSAIDSNSYLDPMLWVMY